MVQPAENVRSLASPAMRGASRLGDLDDAQATSVGADVGHDLVCPAVDLGREQLHDCGANRVVAVGDVREIAPNSTLAMATKPQLPSRRRGVMSSVRPPLQKRLPLA